MLTCLREQISLVPYLTCLYAAKMVKERQDITGLNCIKGASGKLIVDDKGIKDSWKEYMEKLMNEEN